MNKLLLIVKREFTSRVKKKSFLLTTLIVPLIFPSIFGIIFYFIEKENESATSQVIMVLDESGTFDLQPTNKLRFIIINEELEKAKIMLSESDDYGLLYLPDFDIENPTGFVLYAKSNPSFAVLNELQNKIEESIRNEKLDYYNINDAILEKLKTSIDLTTLNVSEGQEKQSDVRLSFGIGYITGFLIYVLMFAYGGQVMQGVIEEKSSRIVEIIVSTVRPFQLMLGKIVGVAAVGLFQLMIWIGILTLVMIVVTAIIGLDVAEAGQLSEVFETLEKTSEGKKITETLSDIPVVKIALVFMFYFTGGYLLYGSLFAAIGSAVDTPSEAQQFMIPIMMPLIAGIFGMTSIVNNPDGNVSFWLSIIPFTSPIAMMGRIGFGVPSWQLVLSMVLLVLGFILTVWLAGRIYRIGILMHGSKVNYKVLAKWLTMKI